jgi:hypothetical protein
MTSATAQSMPAEPLAERVARLAIGYRPGAGPPPLRSRLTAVVALGALVIFAGTAVMLQGARPSVSASDVRVVARLEDFTRAADPSLPDTIPAFLALGGQLGGLVEDAPGSAATLVPVAQAELQKGFCTASLTRLVRRQYPGSYDELSDAELQKRVLAKHPEYANRVCVLPAWVPSPHEIVKYEATTRPPLITPTRRGILDGLLAAVLFAIAGLNAYYRLDFVQRWA